MTSSAQLCALPPVCAVRLSVSKECGGLPRPHHLPEDDVLPVQPRRSHGADEELRAVGVLARVGHRQHASLVVDQLRLHHENKKKVRTAETQEKKGRLTSDGAPE